MASEEKRFEPVRTATSGPVSRRTTNSRPSSRSSSPFHDVKHTTSGQHFDDHPVHHGYSYHRDEEEVTEPQSLGSSSDDGDAPERRDGAQSPKDEEGALELKKSGTARSKVRDPNLVTWDGPDDPHNPKNWSTSRKWAATLVVSSFTFISPLSSSMVAPALSSIDAEFGITNKVVSSMVLSIFVLAYAIGPLFLGPLSELYGRVIVLQLGNLFYLFFNLGCALSQSKVQLIIFRFLAGLGGSAPLVIGGGVLADLFTAEERGKSISVYSLAPLLGPAVGPIIGGFVSEGTTWRWIFYATTIADGVIQACGLFFLQETYSPILLHWKKKKLIKATGNVALHTEYDVSDRTLSKALRISFTRPFKLLGTQPIVQVLALYMAYVYGLTYLVLSTFPTLWTTVYHESIGIGGLNYISIGLGYLLGTQIVAPTQDKIYRALKARNGGVGRPEFRVPLMLFGAILLPIGLFWYGWTAQAHTHWILPNIGTAIYAVGSITIFQCVQTYIVDAYTRYAASGMAAATVLRSLAGFGFPLFAPYMYAKLDYGWGNSLLAFLAIGLGIPAPILLWRYGETLRNKSTYAAGS